MPAAIYLFAISHTWQAVFILLFGALIMGSLDNVVRFILAKNGRCSSDSYSTGRNFRFAIFWVSWINIWATVNFLLYYSFKNLLRGISKISTFENNKKRQIMPIYMQPFIGAKTTTAKD